MARKRDLKAHIQKGCSPSKAKKARPRPIVTCGECDITFQWRTELALHDKTVHARAVIR